MASKGVGSAQKRRRGGQAQVDRGMEAILQHTTSGDVQYVVAEIENEPELAAFMASLLRDGEIQRALQQKKEKEFRSSLGRKLAPRCKKYRFLPKAFIQELLEKALGRSVVPDGDADEGDSMISLPAWRRIVSFGLRATCDTKLPAAHKHSEYEGPLMVVLLKRAAIVNIKERLRDLSHTNAETFGAYYHSVNGDPSKVGCRFSDKVMSLPFPASYFQAGNEWRIEDVGSIYEASIVCEGTGTRQNLWTLYSAEHPIDTVVPDNEWFEYPTACDHFLAAGSRDISAAGSLAPPEPAPATPPGTFADAGLAPPGADEDVPVPTS